MMGKALKTLIVVNQKTEETRKKKAFAHQITQKQLGTSDFSKRFLLLGKSLWMSKNSHHVVLHFV